MKEYFKLCVKIIPILVVLFIVAVLIAWGYDDGTEPNKILGETATFIVRIFRLPFFEIMIRIVDEKTYCFALLILPALILDIIFWSLLLSVSIKFFFKKNRKTR